VQGEKVDAVQPGTAIVGAHAFAHEAGMSQTGALRSSGTYEIMHVEE